MKKETIYDVDYFINKFTQIPDDLWVCGSLNTKRNEKVVSCALGHCGIIISEEEYLENPEALALVKLFIKYVFPNDHSNLDVHSWTIVANINDGDFGNTIPQELFNILNKAFFAKDRILATLHWIKDKQNKEIQKDIYKVVYLDSKLKDKSLIFSN